MSYCILAHNPKKLKINKRSLFNVLEFHDDHQREEREKSLLSQAISYAQNNSTKLYSLRDSTSQLKGILGFLALSASEVVINDTKKPIVLIDFLLANNKYRGKEYSLLDNKKVSAILLEFAIEQFYEVREHVGVSYLVLYPDGGSQNKKLVDFYESMNFKFATNKKEWMYIKL